MIDAAYKLEVIGPPRSQKNNKQIVQYRNNKSKTGWSYALVDNSLVKSWRRAAEGQLAGQWVGRKPIEGKCAAIVTSYLGHRQHGDADNLLAGPLDALQHAGVISNDKIFDTVVSIRKRDRDNPRSEILIMPDEWLDIRVMKSGGES